MNFVTPLVVVTVAVLVSACTNQEPDVAPTPSPTTSSSVAEPDAPASVLGPHRIRITVSGPDDTVMRVARAGTQSEVALRGEPFDFEFTEKNARIGDLGIAVFAKTDTPSEGPLRCKITVNGKTVAEQSTAEPGERGYPEVACVIPGTA
ncbi:MAG: hypothetical protein ACRDQ7_19285 [Haloechinothrix sp.]